MVAITEFVQPNMRLAQKLPLHFKKAADPLTPLHVTTVPLG